MSQDFPQANARLAEVARHWADGEVSHETWRRERRTILREICNRRSDVQIGSALPVQRKVPLTDATSPVMPVMPAVPQAKQEAVPVELAENDDVLILALLLVLVLAGAILVFYLA